MHPPPRELLLALFRAAIGAADPARCLPPQLPPLPRGRTLVVGAGKAAAAMARSVEEHWDGPLTGLVITRYGHGVPCERIEVVEAAHPVPDAAGVAAAARVLALVRECGPEDLVLCLMSGGGSALLSLPAPGVTLADKQALTHALLRSGAAIGEINCVRKHLSAIKGGRLALAAAPARVVTLLISDVAGDDPAVIASGPTAADASSSTAALAILERHHIPVPAAVRAWLQRPESETPKPDDPRLAGVQHRLIATPRLALAAAAAQAVAAGVEPLILGHAIEGEAREVGREHAALALARLRGADACTAARTRPLLLLSGGETTVTVRGSGRGGRNAEYLLGLALALGGAPGVWALAADTDGIDGTENNAGAIVTPATLSQAAARGIDPAQLLAANDAFALFAALGDLVVTGPTRTNVNDFRAILIGGDPA
jgi:glycerate 2-kinase